jgi:DNA mismatch repair protein MutS2
MTKHDRDDPNGVPARTSASTPSLFPQGGDDDPLSALEFPAVLSLVAGHAKGPLGAARVRGRRPSSDAAAVEAALATVGELLAPAERGDALDIPPVPELEPVLERLGVAGSVLDGAELLAVQQTLAAARIAARELARVADEAPRAAALAVPMPDRTIEKRLAEALDEDGELRDSASPGLLRARREIHAARERLIRKLESILRGMDAAAVPAGAQVTVRSDRYVIPVRRDARSRPQGIVHDESASHGTLFLEPMAAIELGNALRAAVAAAEREALAVLRELTERCRPEREAMRAAHEMCVAGDDLMARVRFARVMKGQVPRVGSERLILAQARHPILVERGVEVVPVDLVLEPGERTLLISGPNAGGKTVLLKTLGLAAALAQAGIVPPVGPGSELPVFDRLFVDIGDHQSLAADLSTFSARVAGLRSILETSRRGTLVLIDEIGSGTDPAEGAALAAASLIALTERGALAVATTHLGALKTLAGEVPGIVNGSLDFDAASLRPTYRFAKGVPGRSYGLAIARRLGVDADVLAAAERRVSDRERALDQLLGDVEARARALEGNERALRERLAAVEAREAAAEVAESEQAARDRDLRRREREAEQAGRREARRHLLEARGKVEEAIELAQRAAAPELARRARGLVEGAAAAEARALERLEAAPVDGKAAGSIRPGERVRLATGAEGRAVERRADGRWLVALGAVKAIVPAAQLAAAPEAAGRGEIATPRGDAPPPRAAPDEVDFRGLSGDEAQAATVAALDAAVRADHPRLRIIHGMGTGVVRDRVRRVLRADRRVARFDFAPRHQGGTGVTVVELDNGP